MMVLASTRARKTKDSARKSLEDWLLRSAEGSPSHVITVRQSGWIFRLSRVGSELILVCRVREMSPMAIGKASDFPERRVIFDGIYRPEPLDQLRATGQGLSSDGPSNRTDNTPHRDQ